MRPNTAAARLLAGTREPVRVATTANITLEGLQTIDGVTLVAGDRVLAKNQTDATENGIYEASSGVWYRAGDARTTRAIDKGVTVHTQQGTANAGNVYVFTVFQPDIGDDAIAVSLYLSDDAVADITAAVASLIQAAQDAADAAIAATGVADFATRAAAQAATIPAAKTFVRLAGHTSAADGGAAMYKRLATAPSPVKLWHFRSTDRFTLSGATDAVNGGYWVLAEGFIHPAMLGAVGDGVTDDSLAIQAAVDFGNVILGGGKSRTYLVSMQTATNCITFRSNVLWDGQGCKIVRKAEAWVNNPGVGNLVVGTTFLAEGSAGSEKTDIYIFNTEFDGNGDAMTGVPGPRFDPADGTTILNPDNFQEQSEHCGVSLNYVIRGAIVGCWGYHHPATAFTCGGSQQIVFDRNITYENGKCGIYVSNIGRNIVVGHNHDRDPNYDIFGLGKFWDGVGASGYGSIHVMHDDTRIIGNKCSGGKYGILAGTTGGTGTAADVGERGTIADNIITGITSHALWLQGLAAHTGKRYSITGNHISGAVEDGIFVEHAYDLTFTGNTILQCRFGINFNVGASDVVITGNNISQHSQSGIRFGGCIGGMICGNLFSQNSQHGIDWDGVNASSNTGIVIGENAFRLNGSADISEDEQTFGSGNRITRFYQASLNPASIADGATGTFTVSCPGVRQGAIIKMNFSGITSGHWELRAHCFADDTITGYLVNRTGGAVDLPNGNLNIETISL